MKKILLGTIYFLACIVSIEAQTLYGTTLHGGASEAGTIIKFLPATNNLTVAKSFESNPANPNYANFVQASDGKLYGTAGGGKKFGAGSNGYGVIFSFDPLSSTYTKLFDFNGKNGYNPFGRLIEASNGKLYGTTVSGGRTLVTGQTDGYGVIFL